MLLPVAEEIKGRADPDHHTGYLVPMFCHPFFLFRAADPNKENLCSGLVDPGNIVVFFLVGEFPERWRSGEGDLLGGKLVFQVL